jgi:hypothetical protein
VERFAKLEEFVREKRRHVSEPLFDETKAAGKKSEAERSLFRDDGQAAAAGEHGDEEIQLKKGIYPG